MISETQKASEAIKTSDEMGVNYSKRKSGYQYYLLNPDGKRKYVRKKDLDQVRNILQKNYYDDLLANLKTMRNRILKFLKTYDMGIVCKTYEDLCDAKKALVSPILPTDAQFISEWRIKYQGGMNPFPDQGRYMTMQGEMVRSKSEKILADLFAKHEITYSYEPKLKLNSEKSLYPDFALLNIRTRKTVYWEHLGLISDSEYARNALHKLNQYEMAGLEIGRDLIVTMENGNNPLNIKQIERKIKEYLL